MFCNYLTQFISCINVEDIINEVIPKNNPQTTHNMLEIKKFNPITPIRNILTDDARCIEYLAKYNRIYFLKSNIDDKTIEDYANSIVLIKYHINYSRSYLFNQIIKNGYQYGILPIIISHMPIHYTPDCCIFSHDGGIVFDYIENFDKNLLKRILDQCQSERMLLVYRHHNLFWLKK